MAKTVSDLKIKVGLQGAESFAKLKSAFRGLEKTVGVTDSGIQELRKGLNQFAASSRTTTQSIQGQIEAFKGLRQQAVVGGAVYKQLGNDIDRLTKKLEGLSAETSKMSRRGQSPGFIFGQAPSAEADKFQRQMAAGNELLRKASVTGTDYAETLTTLTARLDSFNRAQARQAVVAKNAATAGLNPIRGQLARQVELPNTMAALRLRVSELTTDLDNLELGTVEYLQTTTNLALAQRALNDALNEGSRAYEAIGRRQEQSLRVQQKLANIQEYYGTVGQRQGGTRPRQGIAPGAGGYRDPRTGAMIARGTVAGRQQIPVPAQVREISGLYQQIGGIGMSGISASIEMMGNSYQKVARDIKAATAASNGSVSSLQAQRSAWASLRLNLNPASKEYREVGKEIERVEKRLNKLNNRVSVGARLRGNLGAAAAGAIFGGPEGLVGGLIAGPGGAAAGASASMLRKSLGDVAAYAAEIKKLQIALQGVTKDQRGYEYSLESARRVTSDFNIPIDQSTRGITRLSAAVLGAGGNVGDAELVFRNVTAAVKATGGSTDDVNSAITAMVQVFSKGKVSAEELSGQLGERLPGAVTLFAKAVYGEGHDAMLLLQKDLKEGKVGLNELMKFAQALGIEYVDLAKKVAASAADAGAKAKVAFDQARLEIGKALLPIGAELQQAIADFLQQNQAEIIAVARALASAFDTLLKVLAFLVKNFEELIAVAAVVGSTAGLIQVTAVVQSLGGIASVTALAMKGLSVSITGVGIAGATLASGGVALLIGGFAALTIGLYNAAFGHRKFAEEVAKGDRPMKEAREELDKLNKSLDDYQERAEKAAKGQGLLRLTQQIRLLKEQIQGLNQAMEEQAYGRRAKGFIGPIPLEGDPDADQARFREYKRTMFPSLTGDEDAGAAGSKKTFMLDEELRLRRELRKQQEEGTKITQLEAEYNLDVYLAKLETEDVNKRQNDIEEARLKLVKAIAGEMDGMYDIYKKQQDMARDFNKELVDRQYQLGIITEQEYNRLVIERERARLKDAYPDLSEGQREQMVELKRREVDPTFAEGLQTQIANLKRELKELTDPVNALVNGATAIGNAFSNSFINVISGSQSAKEALADFFKNVGAYFLDMANQIIAKMIVMALLNTLAKVLPTGGSGVTNGVSDAAYSGDVPLVGDAYKGLLTNAEGGYVMGGFNAFANGGVVSKPTLGLVGEGGEPEFIIPQSKMRSAMKRYSAGARGSGVIPGNGEQGAPTLGGAGVEGGPIDVRYTVERINSVDYVTADQFRTGMSEAAQRGAVQGEQRTLRRLQMSTSTRKRLGM